MRIKEDEPEPEWDVSYTVPIALGLSLLVLLLVIVAHYVYQKRSEMAKLREEERRMAVNVRRASMKPMEDFPRISSDDLITMGGGSSDLTQSDPISSLDRQDSFSTRF